jgi:hypothetical protein
MIRWSELSLGSRLAGKRTRFSLVFHTEGLINDKIAGTMAAFGKGLNGMFRPTMTVVTPLCPQYYIDPIGDPLRTDFLYQEPSAACERDFREKVDLMSEYYDIGYHGHFFNVVEGRCKPEFEGSSIGTQFKDECDHLAKIGHRPKVYAGGWWFLSKPIESALGLMDFRLDTTVNDLHVDSFSRPQPHANAVPGEPFKLSEKIIEVPSVRSINGLTRVLVKRRKMDNFLVLALHDYDLVVDSTFNTLAKVAKAWVKKESILSSDKMIEEANNWFLQAQKHG